MFVVVERNQGNQILEKQSEGSMIKDVRNLLKLKKKKKWSNQGQNNQIYYKPFWTIRKRLLETSES